MTVCVYRILLDIMMNTDIDTSILNYRATICILSVELCNTNMSNDRVSTNPNHLSCPFSAINTDTE